MRRTLNALLICVLLLTFGGTVFAQAGTCAGMSTGQLSNLNGFVPFPSANLWNTDVSSLPVDPNSSNIINFIGSTVTLHPDFGAGTYRKQTIGIPYQVVDTTSQAMVNVTLGLYASESDPGPMPIPSNALIEGYPKPGNGDRHVLVLDRQACWLYELFHAQLLSGGAWSGDSTAVWDMTLNEQRPYTWTSADAAGLPIFVGLVRYDEVAAGTIKHAVRFTVPTTRQAFVLPATHWASTNTSTSAPPMGTRLRLKSTFDISGFSAANQVILTALKKYGMILADNGSGIFISGAPDDRWNNTDLSNLKTITASSFDVVEMGTIYTNSNVPTGPSPVINNFSANVTSVTKGTPVTLSWTTTGQIYNIISPTVGPVRGTISGSSQSGSITVLPAATTTYTLYSTNQYGRATASVTVTVH